MAITITGRPDFDTGTTVVPRLRSLAGATNVPLAGTYTSTAPTHVEAQLNGGSFVELTSETIGGGTWSGTLATVTKGEYTLVVRKSNATGETDTAIFLVGDPGLGAGDSVSVGANITGQLASGANHSWVWHASNSTWFRYDIHADDGCYPLLLTQLAADQGCPQMFIYGGSSGTHLDSWASGSIPNNAVTQVTNSRVDGLRYVLWFLCTNNVITGGGSPGQQRATIAAGLLTAKNYLAGKLITDGVGGTPTHVFYQIGECPSSEFDLRHDIDQVRLGIVDAVAAGTGNLGAIMYDLDYADGTHPDNNDAQQMADRNWMGLKDAVYGGTLGRGPRVTTVTKNPAQTSFVVTYDQNMSNSVSSTVDVFRVLNGDGSAATITSQACTSIRSFTIAVSPAATGTPTVSCASGNDGVGHVVPMSALISMPDTRTTTRPAEPFIEHAVIAATAQGHFGSVMAGIVRGPRK